MGILDALRRRGGPAGTPKPVREPLLRRRPMSRRLSRFVDGFATELSAAAKRARGRRM